MAKIGYARVSSKEQHLDRQLAALKDVDKLFTDKLSGANTNRPELQKMLAYIREGDIVLVTELDRLGRNNQDLTKIMNTIQNKGATLDVLNLPSMTGMVLSPVKLTLIKTKTQFFLSDQIVVIFRHGLVISFSGNELIHEVRYCTLSS